MQDILKEVEVQEPRFISSLNECNGHFEGLEVISPNEFEVVLYLNQMGVFNFVDDGTLPGCAVLKVNREAYDLGFFSKLTKSQFSCQTAANARCHFG